MGFALVPSSLSFLSVEASTFANGQFLIKDTIVTKETTYAVTLRAYVDGKAIESKISVIVTPKPEPSPELVAEEIVAE